VCWISRKIYQRKQVSRYRTWERLLYSWLRIIIQGRALIKIWRLEYIQEWPPRRQSNKFSFPRKRSFVFPSSFTITATWERSWNFNGNIERCFRWNFPFVRRSSIQMIYRLYYIKSYRYCIHAYVYVFNQCCDLYLLFASVACYIQLLLLLTGKLTGCKVTPNTSGEFL
jgi:hypothetical protein